MNEKKKKIELEVDPLQKKLLDEAVSNHWYGVDRKAREYKNWDQNTPEHIVAEAVALENLKKQLEKK